MYGWCNKCKAIAIEGLCSEHGKTKPMASINAIDLHSLTELEKEIINSKSNLKLGDGIFLLYGDRMNHRRIVVLDRPIAELKLKKNEIHVKPLVEGEINGMDEESICRVNADRIVRLSNVVKNFASDVLEEYENVIISFSGGKDSTVLAHLLNEFNLKSVFIDTRIEFPETYRFIKELKAKGWDIDWIKTKNNFFELCRRKGYPSYGNRWCCKTQKFEPFDEYLQQFNGDVLVFSAERRWESLSRLDLPFKKKHKHILQEVACQPLLNWLTLDVWVYVWMYSLPVNDLYKYYNRGGCWVCPFGLSYRAALMKFVHPKLHSKLEKVKSTKAMEMYKLVFPRQDVRNKIAELLSEICEDFEVRDKEKAIYVPASISRKELNEVLQKVRTKA